MAVGALFASAVCYLGVFGASTWIIFSVFWSGLFVMYFLLARASKKIQLKGIDYFYMAALMLVVTVFFMAMFNFMAFVITVLSPELAWVINYALQVFTWLFVLVALGILLYVVTHAVAGRVTRTGLPRGF